MTTQQALNKIASKKGKFFKVSFKRKRDKRINGKIIHKAGDVREMVCRCGVSKFAKGVSTNKYSDAKNNLVTVFDIQTYNYLKKSLGAQKAGQASYRRIPLNNVIDIQ